MSPWLNKYRLRKLNKATKLLPELMVSSYRFMSNLPYYVNKLYIFIYTTFETNEGLRYHIVNVQCDR